MTLPYDIDMAFTPWKELMPEVQNQALFEDLKTKVSQEFASEPFNEQMRERAYIIEMEAMKRVVAKEREQTRIALGIPDRLNNDAVYVYRFEARDYLLHESDTIDIRSILFTDFKPDDIILQVLLTPKQRRAIIGHNAAYRQGEDVDGIKVFGDWRNGYVQVELPADQARLEGTRQLTKPVEIFIGKDHNIVRGPVDAY